MAQDELILQEEFSLPEAERGERLTMLLEQYWRTWLSEVLQPEEQS